MNKSQSHHRGSIRLMNYDYTGAGGYFLTLATYGGAPLFGDISMDQMFLNPYGKIVEEEWLRTPEIRPNIILDEFIIMPNHFHGIIFITETVGAHCCAPLPPNKPLFRPPKSLGAFIAGFKSAVTKRINVLRSTPGTPVWQRNYYEHVIRNNDDINRIREYIRTNPVRWKTDDKHPI